MGIFNVDIVIKQVLFFWVILGLFYCLFSIKNILFISPSVNRVIDVRNFIFMVIEMCYEYNVRNLVEVTNNHDESAYTWALGAIPSFESLLDGKNKLDITYYISESQYLRLLTETRNTHETQKVLGYIDCRKA